ncbi:MAG: phosphoribosylaminoimidazolesuccinocarboxamide synthase [Bernardetiaceae bacterium]|nr:phosphoribosylaminoimidazolesuccinocarboxamide synthase [Bernardetiaceae bacterium]
MAISETVFSFPKQTDFYRGKVRDVYGFEERLALVASDRISAFDVVLPEPIPYKGQVLSQIAAHFLEATSDIVPNWFEGLIHPQVSVGKRCKPYAVEMVIRGYLAGHAWREYKDGKRQLCGVPLPEGLRENDKLPAPIITPSTKAQEGHDEDISAEAIVNQGLVSQADYEKLANYTHQLFERGTAMAAERGLILVDTKYEFGKSKDGEILLIDEIHTPDSSRYFYAEGYDERQATGEKQQQLSKEFVREWLMANGFQGKEGQQIPTMTAEVVSQISKRYIALFEAVTGKTFQPKDTNAEEIAQTIREWIA